MEADVRPRLLLLVARLTRRYCVQQEKCRWGVAAEAVVRRCASDGHERDGTRFHDVGNLLRRRRARLFAQPTEQTQSGVDRCWKTSGAVGTRKTPRSDVVSWTYVG